MPRIIKLLRAWLGTNPIGIFFYSLLAKWYILIIIPSIMVAYWTFKGLDDLGIIDSAYNTIEGFLEESQSIAKNCIPKLLQRDEFINCLQNPPRYEAPQEQKDLETWGKRFLENHSDSDDEDVEHPYGEK